jgi:hypothetical protein
MWANMDSINKTLKRLVRHLHQYGQAPAGEILQHSERATLIRFAGEEIEDAGNMLRDGLNKEVSR